MRGLGPAVTAAAAVQILELSVGFEPCPEPQCVRTRLVERNRRHYWMVTFAERSSDDSVKASRTQTHLIDAETGVVSSP
jgi:hypothetical protein